MTKEMYLFLTDGDIIKATDEYYSETQSKWVKDEEASGGACMGELWSRETHTTYRRKVETIADLPVYQGTELKEDGLTKREWFAGMALQGLMNQRESFDFCEDRMASCSFAFADAMIKKGNE